MKKIITAVSAALIMATAGNASVIVSLNGVTDNLDGTWTWSYDAALQADQNFRQRPAPGSGDFFEIIDFGSYISAVWTPVILTNTWVVIEALTGPGFPPVGNTDSASLMNIVVQLTNAPGGILLGNANEGQPYSLGTIDVLSSTGIEGEQGSYSAAAQQVAGGSTTFNQGTLPVAADSTVPEPATMGLMGGAMLGIAFLLRRRK
jgi:hypothetical protein